MNGLVLPDPGEPRFCGRCGSPLAVRHDGGRDRPHCSACGWTYYGKPALGAAALIEENGRILLVRRAHEPYRGWWTLPAGYVEYGEDAAQTAAREALEETGLVVSIDGFHGIFSGGGDPRGAAHLAAFYATRLSGDLRAADDAAEARWVTAEEMPIEIAFEGTRKAIAAWLQMRRNGPRAPVLLRFTGAGPAPPILVYVVVENPRGSTERIVYNEGRHEFVATGEVFPAPLPIHYGWIPQTFTEADGDDLDAVVIGEGDAAIGSVVVGRPIGALLRADEDHKIVAVRADLASAYSAVMDIGERPELRELIEELFAARSAIRGWATASEARTMILNAQAARIRRDAAADARPITALRAGSGP